MYKKLLADFSAQHGQNATHLFSAPGRTEISGNHTDHQHGCVLATAIDMETVAAGGTVMVKAIWGLLRYA